jgi:hypothetical protein
MQLQKTLAFMATCRYAIGVNPPIATVRIDKINESIEKQTSDYPGDFITWEIINNKKVYVTPRLNSSEPLPQTTFVKSLNSSNDDQGINDAIIAGYQAKRDCPDIDRPVVYLD